MPYSFRDIKKRLVVCGFSVVRQKGSHVLFSNGRITFPVPRHGGKEISPGVELKIIKILGMTKKQFKDL